MKRLYPDPPKPHHMAFPRDFVRDVTPRSEPMRRIDFHEPDANPIDRLIGWVCGVVISAHLVYCVLAYFFGR
jgi:hypothetical protein